MVSLKKNHFQLPPIGSRDGERLHAMNRCGSSGNYASCKGTLGVEPKALKMEKLAFGGLIFTAFTVGVFWYQFDLIQAGHTLPVLSRLQWYYFLFMLIWLPVDTVAGGLRIWIVCRVLEPGISFWTCLKAEWANMGVSMLTPSQTGGGFGQIYMLYRGGTTVATALTISLISFLGSMISLLCIGLYFVVCSGMDKMGGVFGSAVVMFTFISALMVIAAFFPSLFQKAIIWSSKAFRLIRRKKLMAIRFFPSCKSETKTDDIAMGLLAERLIVFIHAYHLDVQRFLRLGKTSFAWVCLLSFIFLFSRALMAFLCLRFLGIQACNLGQVLKTQMNLIFLIYFAPTPGGSGLAEGISLSMMSHIVPIALAPYYNLLWRTTTFYLPALAGLFCLMYAVLRDTGRFVKQGKPVKVHVSQNKIKAIFRQSYGKKSIWVTSKKKREKMPRYAYFTVILCVMLSCANTNKSKMKSEIISSYEKIKPSITYYVDCWPQCLEVCCGHMVFLFDDNKINAKIGEILSKSDLFSSIAEKYYFKNIQDKGHSDDGIADYHFKIDIRWAKRTFLDMLLDSSHVAIWVFTFGLGPCPITNKIEMDIYVTAQDKHLKTYHYEDSVINLQWAPIIEDLKKLSRDQVSVVRTKCAIEVGDMMRKFIRDFSNEWCQK